MQLSVFFNFFLLIYMQLMFMHLSVYRYIENNRLQLHQYKTESAWKRCIFKQQCARGLKADIQLLVKFSSSKQTITFTYTCSDCVLYKLYIVPKFKFGRVLLRNVKESLYCINKWKVSSDWLNQRSRRPPTSLPQPFRIQRSLWMPEQRFCSGSGMGRWCSNARALPCIL